MHQYCFTGDEVDVCSQPDVTPALIGFEMLLTAGSFVGNGLNIASPCREELNSGKTTRRLILDDLIPTDEVM